MEFSPNDFVIEGVSSTEEQERLASRPVTYARDAWSRFRKNKIAVAAAILLLLLVLLVVFGPLVSTYPVAERANARARNLAPSAEHWFGTDSMGRDLFTRTCIGGRASIAIGLTGAVIVIVLGSLYGGLAALLGGRADDLMMRVVDIFSSVPNLLVIILVSVVIDSKSIAAMIFAMTITGWCPTARIVRSQMLQISRSEYVTAARLMDISPVKIVLRHLIPNTMSVILVDTTFRIPGFIFNEAFLSYVGLGVQPPQTSWGSLAAAAQGMFQFYPWQLLFPAGAIALTMLAFTLLGDGLRDALDPRLRR
ncbi:MAG: ABC transporter permease [Oscillospiraceae bacterium]|nr:ABC transporter permease [Oscillospiraceae bacterium]